MVAFVDVALVKTPVDGVTAPRGVFSIVPPEMVKLLSTWASVAEPTNEEKAMPRDEVANCNHVFPAPPINSEEEAIVASPVPPRVAVSVPVHVGVNVWVSPLEVMVRPRLVSDDVANVCEEPVWKLEYCAPSAVMPPPAPASAPQEKSPLFHISLSPASAHSLSPNPLMSEPVKRVSVDVAVEVA